MAATGSAIGLGNVWRFPFICYQNGGGAFLIPFVVAMFTVGIPLLMVEFAIGKSAQKSAPQAFSKIKGSFAFVGWFAALSAFVVVIYYAVIMAWSLNYLLFSFKLSWQGDTEAFFYQSYLRLPDHLTPLGTPKGIIVLGLGITWLLIYLCLFKGIQGVGKVVMVTVPLPALCLLILIVRGITLPGAWEGIVYYLKPDFTKLLQPTVWLAAYGQILFSFSLGQSVLIAYASYLPSDADVGKSAYITAFLDSSFSFFAGFAVFSVLGYLTQLNHQPIDQVVQSGPGLAFVTYPKAISLLPFGAPFFGVIFFLMLLSLGIDSAFALVEGVLAPLRDWLNLPLRPFLGILCFFCFAIGILFTTPAGYFWLDLVDHFINNFGLVTIALLECLIIGYGFGASKLRRYINQHAQWKVGKWLDWALCFIGPAILATILISSLIQRLQAPYGDYPLWAQRIGWLVVLTVIGVSAFLTGMMRKQEKIEEEP